MDGKPLNWDYTGGLFLGISALGRVMIRRPKLRVPKNLSSGYLKNSAPPEIADTAKSSTNENVDIMAQYLIRARLNLPLYKLSNATTSCGRSPDGLSSHNAGLPI